MILRSKYIWCCSVGILTRLVDCLGQIYISIQSIVILVILIFVTNLLFYDINLDFVFIHKFWSIFCEIKFVLLSTNYLSFFLSNSIVTIEFTFSGSSGFKPRPLHIKCDVPTNWVMLKVELFIVMNNIFFSKKINVYE